MGYGSPASAVEQSPLVGVLGSSREGTHLRERRPIGSGPGPPPPFAAYHLRMAHEPLAARMRPRSLDEVVGQEHLLGPGKALAALVEADHLPSIVLWGPAGTGKTTIAHLLARAVGAELVQLSAVSSGVAEARKVMEGARGGMLRTVLFVDEVHRWSKTQSGADPLTGAPAHVSEEQLRDLGIRLREQPKKE